MSDDDLSSYSLEQLQRAYNDVRKKISFQQEREVESATEPLSSPVMERARLILQQIRKKNEPYRSFHHSV